MMEVYLVDAIIAQDDTYYAYLNGNKIECWESDENDWNDEAYALCGMCKVHAGSDMYIASESDVERASMSFNYKRVAVTKDGELKAEWFNQPSDFEAFKYILDNQSQSVGWATTNGGWKIILDLHGV